MTTMTDVDYKRIPLITCTNEYKRGESYRIPDDNKSRYFIFEEVNEHGNFWKEVNVTLTNWW